MTNNTCLICNTEIKNIPINTIKKYCSSICKKNRETNKTPFTQLTATALKLILNDKKLYSLLESLKSK